MFMHVQGIVFIQLQGNYITVNFQGNIFTQRKYIYSQKICSFKEIYLFEETIFIQQR